MHLLHRVGQCAADLFASEISENDLTPRQYAVLVTVAGNEGLSQTGLVERTGIDRSTLADIVRRMLKKGLLQRRRTREDARAYAVRLTDEGWRVLRSAEPLVKRVDEQILGSLPAKQRTQFVDELKAIIDRMARTDLAPQKG
ncbi:MAG TPA: MarR family transcriptional regulator [Hyphomicrobiaceae bacterium]|nr:MarR family transcriptional regulator [Hyphomicrobiaceae bacterium]